MTVRRYWAVGIALLLVLIFQIDSVSAAGPPRIVINIAARTLSYYAGDILVKEYPVAVGTPSSPSPIGEYQVSEKIVNPWWYPTIPGMSPVPSGPDNPLGYRWIGFSDAYGIHGTNAPWSIGKSASKGCIRMHEADVEELFPQIPVGTPVSIIYDPVGVYEDAQGVVYVAVFRDIYGYGTGTVADVRQKLAAIGAEDLASDEEIEQLLQAESGQRQSIGKLVDVTMNEKLLTAKGIIRKDIVYVPAAAIAQATGASLVTGYDAGTMEWQGKTVPALLCSSGMYVRLWALPELLGAQCSYDEATSTAAIEFVQVYVNGKPLAVRTQVIEGMMALPLSTLLAVSGQKADWQPDGKTISIAGRTLPVVFQEVIPYLPINCIHDALNIYVYYDSKTIQLNYIPFIASGP